MTPYMERGRRGAAWLGVVCLGLLPVASLSAQEPKLRATLKGHTDAVVAVAFSPDGMTLASASYDGTLKLWDMTTGKERATLGEYKGCLGCVAFSGRLWRRGQSDRLSNSPTSRTSSCGTWATGK